MHTKVCMLLYTSVNHSLTWAWKIIEGFKIAAAASKIHYPQAAEGHGEKVREERDLLHSCSVRSCSCMAAQPGDYRCSCRWLYAPTQLPATHLGSDPLSGSSRLGDHIKIIEKNKRRYFQKSVLN